MGRHRLQIGHDQGRDIQSAIAEDDRLIDKRAGHQRVFDGGRYDLAARGQQNQGLFAAGQIQIAVPVKAPQVASL